MDGAENTGHNLLQVYQTPRKRSLELPFVSPISRTVVESSELAMPAAEGNTPKKSRAGPAGQPPVVAVASAFAGPSSPPVEMVSPRKRQFGNKKGTRQLNNKGHVETSHKAKKEKEEVREAHARTRKEEGIMKNDLDADSMFGSVCDSDSVTVDEQFYDSSTPQLSCSSCEEEEEIKREESVKIDESVRNNDPIEFSPLRRAAGMFKKKQYKRQNKVLPLFKQSQMQPNYSKIEEDDVEDSSEDSSNDQKYVPYNMKRRSYNRRRRTTRQYQCPDNNTYVNAGLSSDEDIKGQAYSSSVSKPTNTVILKRLAEMEKEIYALQKDNQTLRAKEMNNKMALPEPLQLYSELAEKSTVIELMVPQILCDGGYLWKIPFHRSGTPKRRWIQVLPAGGLKTGPSGHFIPSAGLHSNSNTPTSSPLNCDHRRNTRLGEFITMMAASPVTIIWFDPKCPLHSSPPREMAICDVEAVLGGHKTMAFWQQAIHRGSGTLPAPSLCFSLIGKERTLDLHTETSEQARQWREAFMFLASEYQLQNEENEVQHHKRRQSWDTNRRNFKTDQQLFSGFHSARNARESYFSSIRSNDDYLKMKRREQHRSSASMSLHYPVNVSWSKGALKEWRKHLLSSSRQGDTHDVRSLLEGGCPPDALDPQTGETALSVACQLGHIRIVEVLLSVGAKNDPNPRFGETALQTAVGSSQHLCALALLNQEHAVSGQDAVAIANYLDRHGKAPLHKAAARNDSEMVNILLSYGADVHLLDRHSKGLSWTALHHAAKEGAVMAMSSLLEVCGAEEIIDLPDEVGNCPLHIAVAFNHSEATLLLLQTAADPNPVNASGLSPYSLAVQDGYIDIAEILLEYLPNCDDGAGKRKVKPLATPEVVQQNLLPSEDLPRPVMPSSLQLRESTSTEIGLTATVSVVESENEVSPHDDEGRVLSMLDMESRSLATPSEQFQESDEVKDFNVTVDENAMRTEEDTGTESTTFAHHSSTAKGKPSLLDREQEVHSTGGDGGGGEASMTEAAASPENIHAHHSTTESEEIFSPWQPTEEFETKDGNWSSFFSTEGYPYFVLDSPNKQHHSQWEDPRLEYVAPSVEEEGQCVDVPEEHIDIPTEVFPLECNSLLVPAIQPLLLLPPPQSPPGNNKQLKTPATSPLPPIHNTPKNQKTCAEMGGSTKSPTTLQSAVVEVPSS